MLNGGLTQKLRLHKSAFTETIINIKNWVAKIIVQNIVYFTRL